MTNKLVSHEAKLLIQLGATVDRLWRARDRAWKLACERSRWKLNCLEQCRLLAMSADREEKLRTDLALAHKLADAAIWEADRLRAQLRKEKQ